MTMTSTADQHRPHARLQALEQRLATTWEEIFKTSPFIHCIQRGEVTKPLYALYMLQTYHYTLHNVRNQALVGVNLRNENRHYLKFCFEHASEEVGHEQMALHDVMSLGLKGMDIQIPPPLPETEVLIGYLYWISSNGNPLRRLGYSYWAESCYQYINPVIAQVRATLKLTPAQMTFFIAHGDIDREHIETVNEMLVKSCKTDEDWEAVADVMETSLRLTGRMMDAVHARYVALRESSADAYAFLSKL